MNCDQTGCALRRAQSFAPGVSPLITLYAELNNPKQVVFSCGIGIIVAFRPFLYKLLTLFPIRALSQQYFLRERRRWVQTPNPPPFPLSITSHLPSPFPLPPISIISLLPPFHSSASLPSHPVQPPRLPAYLLMDPYPPQRLPPVLPPPLLLIPSLPLPPQPFRPCA